MSIPVVPSSSHSVVHIKEASNSLIPATVERLRVLRLSVTDLCNFRCRYCMPENGVPKLAHTDLLSLESMGSLVGWLAANCGIERVRLTGGEPTARPGLQNLIAQLLAIPTIKEVSLTTNGSLLSKLAWPLKEAGLSRLNISLDSLNKERFRETTRGGDLDKTLAGIQVAVEAGLTPIKLNAVLLRSSWKEEVPLLLDYAASNGFEIRFIELMRTGTEREWCESEYISVDEVCRQLGADVTPIKEKTPSPARRTLVNWRGAQITVGWITPRSHPFCASCERLRLDVRGRLRRCLMDSRTFDLHHAVTTMEAGVARQEFFSYIVGKYAPRAMDNALAMSQIGG